MLVSSSPGGDLICGATLQWQRQATNKLAVDDGYLGSGVIMMADAGAIAGVSAR